MDEGARNRLREARAAAGLSVRELSRRVGISPSMLSQIENGHAQPSVATLYGIVSALSISVDAVLTGGDAPAPFRTTGGTAVAPVLRGDERAALVMESGVRWERLTPTADPLVDALLVTYPPGSSSSGNGGLMRHAGHEYGYLMEGELVVQVGFDTFALHAGDSVSFDSTIPHLYRNESNEAARGIWHVLGHDPEDPRVGPG